MTNTLSKAQHWRFEQSTRKVVNLFINELLPKAKLLVRIWGRVARGKGATNRVQCIVAHHQTPGPSTLDHVKESIFICNSQAS